MLKITAIYRECVVPRHIIAIIQAILLWCVAMSLYWRSVHILGNFRIYLYIRSLVVSQSRMYGSLTHIPLIMQNVTCISLNTGLDHCLVTWRQEIMARTNAEYQSLTIVHFYGNILKSSYLQKASRFFIWHICIHILVDYELTRVYESYLYIHTYFSIYYIYYHITFWITIPCFGTYTGNFYVWVADQLQMGLYSLRPSDA